MNRNVIRATALFAVAALTACHGGGVMPPAQARRHCRLPAAARFRCFRRMRCEPSVPRRPIRARCAASRSSGPTCAPPRRRERHHTRDTARKICSTRTRFRSATARRSRSSTHTATRSLERSRRLSFVLQVNSCTTGNGCLVIRNQTGGTQPPPANSGWDQEQALDLDMVSAACPRCHLVLFRRTPTTRAICIPRCKRRRNSVRSSSATRIGGSEYTKCGGPGEGSDPRFRSRSRLRRQLRATKGGGFPDCGGPQQPCSLSTVVCVGGTKLVHRQRPARLERIDLERTGRRFLQRTVRRDRKRLQHRGEEAVVAARRGM